MSQSVDRIRGAAAASAAAAADIRRLRIAVLMGGWSVERPVSLVSGGACADALVQNGHDVTRIDVPRDPAALIRALTPAPDVVFNALHGRWGEDGTIQGLLDIMAIPYTHSGRLASAMAMDKPRAITLFRAAGIACPDGLVIDDPASLATDPMPRPYVVKPACEGSSLGVQIIDATCNGPRFEDWSFGPALVEEFVPGRELTVSVMDGEALCVTELVPEQGFYDYEAKYTDGKTRHLCPAPLEEGLARRCREAAESAHRALGCRGISRADFRYDPDRDRLVLLEINTQPGMTPLSLVPEQAAHRGMDFPALVQWLVEAATCDS